MKIDHQQCAGPCVMQSIISEPQFIKQLSQICHQLVAQSTMLMRGVSSPQFLNAQGTKIDATTQTFKSARESFFVVTVNRSIFWCGQSSATGVTPVASYEAIANVIFYDVTELQNVLSTF